MAYVRTRTTKAGTVSTSLVEAYRDENGQPRQRLLANLHGEPDTLSALAKLAARRDELRKEKEELGTTPIPQGWEDIAPIATQVRAMLKRFHQIESDLATIQKDGVVIKKHCAATPQQVQAAIHAYKQKHSDAAAWAMGLMASVANSKIRESAAVAALKRVSFGFDVTANRKFVQGIMKAASDEVPAS
jgi:hypothetical protein